VAEWLGRRS